jgi:hypothetical protein
LRDIGSHRFLIGEWRDVVDAWQLATWEHYRDVARLGRKTRIGGKQREILWSIFERVRGGLAERKAITWPALFGRITAHIDGSKSPFDFVVVDEAQDVGVAELRFLASLGASGGRWASLQVILVSAFSNSRFRGDRSVSMSVAGLIRCELITALHTRSESRPIGCCRQL